MAQKVNILLVDDLDGTDATQTIAFGLDGTEYEIDLNDEHSESLRTALAEFVGHARKVGRGKGRSSNRAASTSTSGGGDKAAVREWAKAQGMEVSERGRIPADVQEAYDAAQAAPASTTKNNNRGGKRRSAEVTAEGKVEAK